MKLKDLENKKVLILGVEKEGMASFRFLRKIFPNKILGLADQLSAVEKLKLTQKAKEIIKKDKRKKLHLGKNYLLALSQYDVIFKAPGVPWKKISPYLNKKQKVTSQTEVFLENCPSPIIGVTGTKGKGTTVSLIYKILKQEGLKVRLIGNIGKPVLSFLSGASKTDVFVFEMSSHQLCHLKKSPSIAVFLNLYPAHLDYYKSFKEYKKSKENITLWQTKENYFIFNKDQKCLRELARRTKAKKISFGLKTKSLDCYVEKDWVFYKKEKILKTDQIPLKGEFYLYNIMAAITAAKLFKVSAKKIRKAIKEFKPLPHRLEFVGKFKGIKFYNDSLATIPESVILAIKTLNGKVQTILLGGYEAKQDFKALTKEILRKKIKNLIFFPPTGKRIWEEVLKRKKSRLPKAFFVDNMKEAVKIAFAQTEKGKICLLSPACPSFGVFKNYKERGNLFKKFVKLYGQEKN